jgi:hypothetical protein
MQSVTDYEPPMRAVLDFVLANPHMRSEFASDFMTMLEDSNLGPWELIEYCMHTLRWPEIEAEAIRQIRTNEDPRVHSVMSHILHAFADDWSGADMYVLYSCPRT